MVFSQEASDRWAMKANIGMGVLLPLLELAAIGVTSWVVLGMGIDAGGATRIGILTGHCILLVVLLVVFATLLIQIWVDPGRVSKHEEPSPAGDAFLCDHTGKPRFCEECGIIKPTRTSHCSILNRCIRRYDHYCPYAGGVVSATTHKLFFLFVFYACFYTLFTLTTIAVFLKKRIDNGDSKPASWIASLSVSALFFLFSIGMCFETFKNILANTTSVENLKKDSSQYIAIRGKSADALESNPIEPKLRERTSVLGETERDGQVYIIFQLNPGFGSLFQRSKTENFRSIMGQGLVQWLSPFSRSPVAKAADDEPFTWGFSVEALMFEYACGYFLANDQRSVLKIVTHDNHFQVMARNLRKSSKVPKAERIVEVRNPR